MKLTKTLIAASLSAVAGLAQAATFSSADEVLNIVDTTNSSSYSLDLGMTPSQIESATLPLTYNLANDTNYTNFVNAEGNGDNIVYSVEGEYNAATSGKAIPHLDSTFTTSTASDVAAQFPNGTSGVGTLNTATNAVASELGTIAVGATGMSVYHAAGDNNYDHFGLNNAGTLGTLSNGASLNTALSLWEVNKVSSSSTNINETVLAPVTFANSTLTIGTATSAVPVPGSVWMFLSGVAGLLSLKRRKAV